ncbi:translocation/assembly module TamB domain-containing protein [Rufibacter roseus]|uniref:Translocation/assembly module TamB domain-containing protein n=1 Tax=Rufibacter roseus TaxID=1567108 RepID=A0ABW2DSY4_9BACT|nr:translocation/assembly module TamB domain-containing protein [Rufibacter roseus]
METQNQEETQDKKNNRPKVIVKAFLKIILGLLIFVVVLMGVLMIALRFPAVQTKVAQKAAKIISETVDHQVSIGRVDIEFFKNMVLEDVRVLDRQGNTLFYIGKADAEIGVLSLFQTNPAWLQLWPTSKGILLFSKSKPRQLHINSLTLQNPEANLIKPIDSDTLNMSAFISSLANLITQDTTSKPFNFTIDEVNIKNGHFTYHNYHSEPVDYRLDYQHLDLLNINGSFSEIEIKGDTIYTVVSNLTARDRRSGTFLKNLDTRMTYAPTFWEWDNLDLRVNGSHVAKYVRFDYEHFFNFVDFNDSVHVTADFDSTYVRSDDVALFSEVLKDWDEEVLLSGKAKGWVNDFDAQDVDITYGANTRITGDFSAEGLPDFRNTFATLELGPSSVNARDLQRYIPKDIYVVAARAGTIKFEGAFTGFYNDFVANGNFNTALGKLESDINLKFDKQNANHSSYRGYLKTTNFDVGGLIGDRSVIKTITMNGRVQGSGFSLSSARLNMDATVNAIHVNNYNYRNIVVDADLSRETFQGNISIKDPNLQLDATGQINLQNKQQVFDLTTQVERADLKALGLTDRNLVLQTVAEVDFTGIQLDEISGTANFKNTTLWYDGNQVEIDSLNILSHFHDNIRELHVGSEILALRAGGNFEYSTLFEDLQTLYHEYELNLENDPAAIERYYSRKPNTPPQPYEIELDVHLRHINPVLHVFAPNVSVSDFSRMEGTFRNGPTTILSLVGYLDTVVIGKNQLYKNEFEITSSKLWNSPDVLANTVYTSERQKLIGAGDTENLYVEGVWSDRLIRFSSNIAQTGTTNRANISGNVLFEQDDIKIVFNQSAINILDRAWTISPNNTIVFDDGTIYFDNITFSNGPQSISVFGRLSENPQETLTVDISDFQLENLNPLLTDKIGGRLNAELLLRNLYSEVALSSTLAVDSFTVSNQYIGNIAGTTTWDNAQDHMKVDLGISRSNQKVLSLTGSYDPNAENQQLNLLAVMDNAQLKLVEPLVKVVMTDLGGTMDGRVRITGRLTGPILQGSVMVTNGSFVFGYLKTKYSFSDRVYFNEDGISFQNVRLRDIYNNTAIVNGGIYHNGFSNMVLDLRARFTRFMVLNTTREDNPMYYGTAFATGEASALGAPSNLQVNITARSEPNTNIAIPFDNTTSLERSNFITFVNTNVNDSVGTPTPVVKIEEQQSVDLSGIRLNFNFDIDENAYIELIFDERTGDIIRGRGQGNIRMVIDTRGEFSMYGTYEILQGRYNFTMLGIINKEFNIRPGGTVTWNGDPLEGMLNITAAYTQRVSLAPILATSALSEQQLQSAAAQTRYPVTAVMKLEGPIMTPQISLNMEFNDTPNLLQDQITAYLNNIRNDEQELNRQVFSLLAFKRLSNQNEIQLGLVGDLGSSVGELFSNQLSYWLSQIDSNLEVDIGVSGYGDQVLDDVQLRLSYTFMEGRLRVTREGSVNNNRYGNGRANAAGDWSIEYYLSKDGQLRLRATYETTPRDFEAVAATSRTKVSVLHQANFDRIGELFRRRRLSRRARRAAQRVENTRIVDDTPTPPNQLKIED